MMREIGFPSTKVSSYYSPYGHSVTNYRTSKIFIRALTVSGQVRTLALINAYFIDICSHFTFVFV